MFNCVKNKLVIIVIWCALFNQVMCNKMYIWIDYTGYDKLYYRIYSRCMATAGKVYSSQAPILTMYIWIDHPGYDKLYYRIYSRCMATAGKVYSSQTPILTMVLFWVKHLFLVLLCLINFNDLKSVHLMADLPSLFYLLLNYIN